MRRAVQNSKRSSQCDNWKSQLSLVRHHFKTFAMKKAVRLSMRFELSQSNGERLPFYLAFKNRARSAANAVATAGKTLAAEMKEQGRLINAVAMGHRNYYGCLESPRVNAVTAWAGCQVCRTTPKTLRSLSEKNDIQSEVSL